MFVELKNVVTFKFDQVSSNTFLKQYLRIKPIFFAKKSLLKKLIIRVYNTEKEYPNWTFDSEIYLEKIIYRAYFVLKLVSEKYAWIH